MGNELDRISSNAIIEIYHCSANWCPSGDEIKYLLKKDLSVKDLVETSIRMYGSRCKEGALPITLAIFVKNNEDSLGITLNNMKDVVSEIVVVDTGSTDSTVNIAKSFGAKVYNVGFTDFGSIRTLTANLATCPWVLMLDSDEILCPEEIPLLETLIDTPDVHAWGLPRRRWADLEMTEQVELEAYPDTQWRLFRNPKVSGVFFKYRVHEAMDGTPKKKVAVDGPHIEHLQDVFKSGARLRARNTMYKKLLKEDVSEGRDSSVKPVAEMDDI